MKKLQESSRKFKTVRLKIFELTVIAALFREGTAGGVVHVEDLDAVEELLRSSRSLHQKNSFAPTADLPIHSLLDKVFDECVDLVCSIDLDPM